MEIRIRQLVALVAASAVLSTGIGFAFAQAGNPDASTAARGSHINRELTQLRQIKRTFKAHVEQLNPVQRDVGAIRRGVLETAFELDKLNDKLGPSTLDAQSVQALLVRICARLDSASSNRCR